MAGRKDSTTKGPAFPVTLQHADGRERLAYSIGDVVGAEWDGFALPDGVEVPVAEDPQDQTPPAGE